MACNILCCMVRQGLQNIMIWTENDNLYQLGLQILDLRISVLVLASIVEDVARIIVTLDNLLQ